MFHKRTPIYRERGTGFTLLELLVVVAIITFLSSLSIIALAESQRNSRDKQRQVDMLTIIKAVELYTTDNGTVPPQLHSSIHDTKARTQTLLSEGLPRVTPLGIPTALAAVPPPPQKGANDGGFGPGFPPPGSGNNAFVCGDGVCETWDGESIDTCPVPGDCGGAVCDNDAICEGASGEDIDNCPNDCYTAQPPGDDSSGGGVCDGDGLCDAGETPGNCSADCTSSSMCYVSGEWDLCCLLGGSHCSSVVGYCQTSTNIGCVSSTDCPAGESCVGTAQGGYYGVCNGSRCEQHYLLQRPPFSCSDDDDCSPDLGGSGNSNGFVSDNSSSFLAGLKPYLVSLPKDPGGKKACTEGVGGDTAETCERLRHYWCSSHPGIVKNHRFCCYASMENANNNIWPHPELLKTPTVDGDPRWTVSCAS